MSPALNSRVLLLSWKSGSPNQGSKYVGTELKFGSCAPVPAPRTRYVPPGFGTAVAAAALPDALGEAPGAVVELPGVLSSSPQAAARLPPSARAPSAPDPARKRRRPNLARCAFR